MTDSHSLKNSKDSKKFFVFILSLIALIFLTMSASSVDSLPEDGPFRFILLGDMHIGCAESGISPVQQAAIEKVIELNPALVIQLGDFINVRDDAETLTEQCVNTMWQKARTQVIDPITGSGSLFFYTPGNHDGVLSYTGSPVDTAAAHDMFWSSHAQRNRNYEIAGPGYHRYYSFTYGNSKFISLFAPGTAGLRDSGEQMDWLREVIQQPGAEHVFTFAHSPLSAPARTRPNEGSLPAGPVLSTDRDLITLLKSGNVEMHFGGHIHLFDEMNVEGIRNIIPGPLGGGRSTLASSGLQSNWSFVVVDVDGSNMQFYHIEGPPFDTSAVPATPVVNNPVSPPGVPSSLAGVGVCPPGMRPAQQVEGGIASMVRQGILGDASSASILAAARRYQGRAYGNGAGEFVCVSLVAQVLLDIGVRIDDDMRRQIYISGAGMTIDEMIAQENPFMRGVEKALVDEGIADTVSVADARPGDFVQYWFRSQSDNTWKGHAVIIEEALGNGHFDLFGAHSGSIGVGTLSNVNLGDPEKKVFIARLRSSAVSTPSSSVSGSPAGSSSGSSASSGAASPSSSTSDIPESSDSSATASPSDAAQSASPTPSPTASPSPPPTTSPGSSASTVSGCGQRLALVGDSLTACSINYVRFLRNLCGEGTVIKNEDDDPATNCNNNGRDKFAHVGKRTGRMKDDFSTVLAWNPDTIVLLGGTNDLSVDWEIPKTNLLDMYNIARGRGIRIVAITLPPFLTAASRPPGAQEKIELLNNWIMTQAPVDIRVNIYDDLVAPGTDDVNHDLYGGDDMHPNAAGKEIMAREVYNALTGAAPTQVQPSATGPGAPSTPSASIPGAQITCVPDSVLPRTLYDFLINSSSGLMTIVGIARQNIAVGINKSVQRLSFGAACDPLPAEFDYNIDRLKSTYGRTQIEVESQLTRIPFMSQESVAGEREGEVQVHRLIAPAVQCVEQEIQRCGEGREYPFRTVDSYAWQALAEDPSLLATSSFGISLNINLDTNPNDQSGELTTDIPTCVVDAFKRFGFKWGGDFENVKSPAHFEFMGDPSRIAVLTAEAASELQQTEGITVENNLENVPIAADENGEAKVRFARAIHALGDNLPYNEQTQHPTCCGDWVAMVYKWSGYAYQYSGRNRYSSLQALANDHGYPIGYNDNRGSAGHALILLGFGPEANWWLEQFPDVPTGSHPRSVSENEALVISYLGATAKRVAFFIYPRNRFPESVRNTRPGQEGPAEIVNVHRLTPLCDGEYAQDTGDTRYGDRYAGQYSWSNDQAGGPGNPWSRFWEPDSPFYPSGGRCSGGGAGTVVT